MFKRFNKVQSESESFLHQEIQQYSLQSRKIQCSDYLSNITSLQFHFLVIFVFHFALIGAKSKGLDLEDEFDGNHHLNIHNQSFIAFHDCHCLLHFEPCNLFAREKVTILYTFPYLILSYF